MENIFKETSRNFVQLIDKYLVSNKPHIPQGSILLEGAKCNMKCDYCFVNACSEEKDEIGYNESAILKTLSQVDPNKTAKIDIWAGEPLFNKEAFIKLCTLINSTLPNAWISINTNGTLLDDWWADFLISHNVYVNLSHDGPGQKYRGLDYFNIDRSISAIKKLVKAGHIKSIVTVVHKNNCNFYEIKNFFKAARQEKGIIPEDYEFILVAPSTSNKIVYDFDYMDPSLIKYTQDTLKYVLKSAIQHKPIYPGMANQLWSIIRRLQLSTPDNTCITDACNEYRHTQFSIDTLGEHRCIRGFFNREENKRVIEHHLATCSKCNMRHACPLSKCVSISVTDELCAALKNRLATVNRAFEDVLSIWKAYESS